MRKFLIIILVLAGLGKSHGQDFHFSQTTRTPLLTNPALAGSEITKFRMIMNYRDQWKNITNPYRTMAAAFDMNTAKSGKRDGYFGFGLAAYRDVAGVVEMSLTRADFSMAYYSILSPRMNFTAGIQAGYVQQSIDESKLRWGNQFNGSTYDGSMASNEENLYTVSYPDFSGGVSWSYRKRNDFSGIIGAAIHHVAKPHSSFLKNKEENLYRKIVIHGHGVKEVKNTNYAFAPDFSIAVQKTATKIMLGSLMKVTFRDASAFTGFIRESVIWYGAHYRVGDAMVFSFGFDKANYSVGFSYDATLSKLSAANNYNGGFEVSLKIISLRSFHYSKAKF